eukprot:13826419-Alexandrium_andersonii.AAC.1
MDSLSRSPSPLAGPGWSACRYDLPGSTLGALTLSGWGVGASRLEGMSRLAKTTGSSSLRCFLGSALMGAIVMTAAPRSMAVELGAVGALTTAS